MLALMTNSSPGPLQDAWLQTYRNSSYTEVTSFHKLFHSLLCRPTLEAPHTQPQDSPTSPTFLPMPVLQEDELMNFLWPSNSLFQTLTSITSLTRVKVYSYSKCIFHSTQSGSASLIEWTLTDPPAPPVPLSSTRKPLQWWPHTLSLTNASWPSLLDSSLSLSLYSRDNE